MLDQCTKVIAEWHALWGAALFLHNKGVALPGAVMMEAMREPFNNMKLFLCVCSAWDLLLGDQESTKRQRHADAEAFKNVVNANCAETFPASLMMLIEMWMQGKTSLH